MNDVLMSTNWSLQSAAQDYNTRQHLQTLNFLLPIAYILEFTYDAKCRIDVGHTVGGASSGISLF